MCLIEKEHGIVFKVCIDQLQYTRKPPDTLSPQLFNVGNSITRVTQERTVRNRAQQFAKNYTSVSDKITLNKLTQHHFDHSFLLHDTAFPESGLRVKHALLQTPCLLVAS